MNLEFPEIDFNDPARWPKTVKIAAIIILCVAVLAAGIWLDTLNQIDVLDKAKRQEVELKKVFSKKQIKAANLEAYRAQMVEMKKSFGTMLRQLPGKTEVEELLEVITQKGIANGLEFELFKPGAPTQEEFYSELPIQIKVIGTYHNFGRFVSAVATLPRIVTLHDFSIKPIKGKGQNLLVMEATAKTYHYVEEE